MFWQATNSCVVSALHQSQHTPPLSLLSSQCTWEKMNGNCNFWILNSLVFNLSKLRSINVTTGQKSSHGFIPFLLLLFAWSNFTQTAATCWFNFFLLLHRFQGQVSGNCDNKWGQFRLKIKTFFSSQPESLSLSLSAWVSQPESPSPSLSARVLPARVSQPESLSPSLPIQVSQPKLLF